MQVKHVMNTHFQIPYSLAHVYTLNHSFMEFALFSKFTLSILTQTSIFWFATEAEYRTFCLGLFLIPLVLATMATLTPGFPGLCPHKASKHWGPWLAVLDSKALRASSHFLNLRLDNTVPEFLSTQVSPYPFWYPPSYRPLLEGVTQLCIFVQTLCFYLRRLSITHSHAEITQGGTQRVPVR